MPDPSVIRRSAFEPLLAGDCVDAHGEGTTCCMWETKPWVPAAQMAVVLTLMWTLALLSQLRTYVIGGTVTQWCVPKHAAWRGVLATSRAPRPKPTLRLAA